LWDGQAGLGELGVAGLQQGGKASQSQRANVVGSTDQM
jgi:hypothetical protein